MFLLLVVQFGFAQSKYIQKYRPLADSLSIEYGIPAAVMLGVAIIESGSCTSRNYKLLNNHFGIVGKNKLLKTKGIKTRYKQYDNATESYIDFCKLVKKRKFYKKLKGNMDYKLWIEAISNSNYSEAPVTWKQRILAVIKKNKLSAIHYKTLL
jgi:flagellum-specific peptidoglycan hydrolase FlgJ